MATCLNGCVGGSLCVHGMRSANKWLLILALSLCNERCGERRVCLGVGCVQDRLLQVAALPAGQAGEAAGPLLQQHQQQQQGRKGHRLDGRGDDERLLEVQPLDEQPALADALSSLAVGMELARPIPSQTDIGTSHCTAALCMCGHSERHSNSISWTLSVA